MPARVLIVALLVSVLAPTSPACPPRFLDPVTTFTNGIALPSTDPYRSHNVYWQGDPYRHGCCAGEYNYPCIQFAIHPNCCGCDPSTHMPGADCNQRASTLESMESHGVITLGQLPPPSTGLPAPASR